MANKSVAFFQENLSDRVVSINSQGYGGTIAVATFPSQYPFTWLQADLDGVQDLSTQIDDSITSIEATFKRADDNNYIVYSNDFVGGHPPRRPH